MPLLRVLCNKYLVVGVLCFGIGFYIGWQSKSSTRIVVDKPIIHTEYQTKTITEVKYIEKDKPTVAKPVQSDIQVNAPAQRLVVEVNGRQQTVEKADDEKFVLEKNKIAVEQNSTATLKIEVPSIDRTKDWMLGGMAGTDGLSVVGGWQNIIGEYKWKYNGGYAVSAGYVMRW